MSNPAQRLLADLDQMQHKLDAAIEHAFTKVSEVKHSNAELWEKLAEEAAELTDYQVEMMRAEILAHERTPKWQRVLDRIDDGEITWRQIAVSYYTRRMDPDVKVAFDSLQRVPSLTPEQLSVIAAEIKKQFEPTDAAPTEQSGPTGQADPPEQPPVGRARRRIIQW